MELSVKQKNELLTGVVLAQELTPIIEGIRRFITVRSFKRNGDGSVCHWGKRLPAEEDFYKAIYNVRVYSVEQEVIEYDIDESQLLEHKYITVLRSTEELYACLKEYITNLSQLVPQWDCDNPIE